MTQEIRWRYRFDNFSRAYSRLKEALETEIEVLNRLEQEGVIQRFEYTFELAWKVLKDRMEYDGVMLARAGARDVLREAAAAGLVSDRDTWLNMLTDRNDTSHRYDFDVFGDVLYNIRDNYVPVLEELYQRLLLEVQEWP